MFKTPGGKQSFAQQLRNKFTSLSTPNKDGSKQKHVNDRKLPKNNLTYDDDLMMHQTIKEKMTPNNNEYIDSYSSFFLEHSIAAEFNHLKKTRLPGVYVIPSYDDPLVWFGVIFIRQGIYQDGVFRFTMTIPNNYPDGDCPKVTFTPSIFHPFINSSTGDLDLERAFSTWRPNVNHIWQILLYLRRIFYKFDAKDPINSQAADLYESDLSAYKIKVRDVISEINNKVYEDTDTTDAHAFRFREWNEDTHGAIKNALLKPKVDDEVIEDEFTKPKLSGMSFVEPGTSLIFSKER